MGRYKENGNWGATNLVDLVKKLYASFRGLVPSSRTVNGKPLSADVTLTAQDVGAAAAQHGHACADIYDFPAIPEPVTVDPSLDGSSQNPVENRAVSAALDSVSAAMLTPSDVEGIAGAVVSSGGYVTSSGVADAVSDAVSAGGFVTSGSLAAVATTGSYNDLTDKPSIPASYVLPNATSSVKGGVIVGSGLDVSAGKISVAGSYATSANVSSILSDGGYVTSTYVAGATVASAATATNATSLGGSAASEYVTCGGTQTIRGAKTFTNTFNLTYANPYYNLIETDVVRGVGADSDGTSWQGVRHKDKNGATIAETIAKCNATNCNYSATAYAPNGSSSASIGVLCTNDNAYGFAPTPADGDSSTKIATTAFLARAAAGYVKTTTDQTISGNKTFAQTVTISGDADVVLTGTGNLIRQNTSAGGTIVTGGNTQSYSAGARLNLYGAGHTSAGVFILNTGKTNNSLIGSGTSLTWRGNPVQTSSDERLKQNVIQVPAAVLDAWHKVNWTQFKYVDAVNEKGAQNARWHTGLVAQHVSSAMAEAGQDACAYGILCHDAWQDEYVTVKNDDGTSSRFLEKPAGDQWTVRYTEALAMEAAYQRRRADRMEERIAALEAVLSPGT